MRTIGVVTAGRSDYSCYLPVLKKIRDSADLKLRLFACGTHVSADFGLTEKEILKDGFEIDKRVETVPASDKPEDISRAMGLTVSRFAEVYAKRRPDILLLLGDRYEMFAAAAASLPFVMPLAHIHGGESTEALIDEAMRHSITKMSHLHFVSMEAYRDRVMQMGEEPWRVVTTGAPALDNLNGFKSLSREDCEKLVGMPLEPAPLLATFHPVTLEHQDTAAQITEFLAALEKAAQPVIFTYPNADTQGRTVMDAVKKYVQTHKNSKLISNFGTAAYFSMMGYAAAMVGNSSSGILEAASFELPCVNVGDRQLGRLYGKNVVSADCERKAIGKALEAALDKNFKEGLKGIKNPYGDGRASERIVESLRGVKLDNKLMLKKFYNLKAAQ